jgi:hypothetical protein
MSHRLNDARSGLASRLVLSTTSDEMTDSSNSQLITVASVAASEDELRRQSRGAKTNSG